MIGKLKGRIDTVDEDSLLLDVGGVGYHVFCSGRTLATIGGQGDFAELIIETHVREDHIHLYGFANEAEREWFRVLATVQRVGNRVALAILGALTPQQIMQAILARDMTAFSRISGIGGKLAERIVTELKDKALKVPVDSGQWTVDKPASLSLSTADRTLSAALEDTISALTHLGYSRSEAYTAAQAVAREVKAGTGVDELIRRSLKELAG